ncbi:mechanosensitive ion channel protein MscS [Pontibacillus halophilus JSM 076056 = DSM 19796]|uniref:Mechanosensitive ion channel protein MscS n=1 Tax=Pontibacillus halophilus JSM 076056 = DSM 19796 TaxID=1385510 RepID=A0A0A5ICW4_9BACI|nr:mechanosensitive ion channel protein MscS [Pontibacillus halophilus JSM 076056 = DSM 19796]
MIGLALLVIRVGRTLIHNLFKRRRKGPFQITHRREMTLSRLLENMLKYIVYFAGIVMILETLGIPVSSLLAGAGIAGLAIGFGAQNLVKDIITGFFIIFEDQFSVGDYIKASSMEGFVEEIGIRTTKIKSWTGELHVIPNGNIAEITNYSMHNGVAVVDLSIAYEGQIDQAEEVIEELLLELPKKYEDFITVPELLGVQSLGSSDVILRVIAEVAPMNHWPAARILRKELKNRLDERGIEIPFPRLVMYNRQEEMEQATNGGVR